MPLKQEFIESYPIEGGFRMRGLDVIEDAPGSYVKMS